MAMKNDLTLSWMPAFLFHINALTSVGHKLESFFILWFIFNTNYVRNLQIVVLYWVMKVLLIKLTFLSSRAHTQCCILIAFNDDDDAEKKCDARDFKNKSEVGINVNNAWMDIYFLWILLHISLKVCFKSLMFI